MAAIYGVNVAFVQRWLDCDAERILELARHRGVAIFAGCTVVFHHNSGRHAVRSEGTRGFSCAQLSPLHVKAWPRGVQRQRMFRLRRVVDDILEPFPIVPRICCAVLFRFDGSLSSFLTSKLVAIQDARKVHAIP